MQNFQHAAPFSADSPLPHSGGCRQQQSLPLPFQPCLTQTVEYIIESRHEMLACPGWRSTLKMCALPTLLGRFNKT